MLEKSKIDKENIRDTIVSSIVFEAESITKEVVKYENNIEQAFYTFLNTVFNNKSLSIIRKKYNTFDKE